MNQPITFSRLQVEGWRQFDSIDLSIHPRLTIITGANGSGKSTLLTLFSTHFGFNRALLATPSLGKSGGYEFVTGLYNSILNRFSRARLNLSDIGLLTYTNNVASSLQVPASGAVQYSVMPSAQQQVTGIHVDSHRPAARYQGIGQIQTSGLSAQNAYATYNNEIMQYYNGAFHQQHTPLFRMKEALVNMALFGEGNKYIVGNPEILEIFEGFSKVLAQVLPDTLGFKELTIRQYEVIMITQSGEFMIDAASGGVMALIDLAWRIHLFSQKKEGFVVTMDEPENHLHPSMQRSLMRRFMAAFPKAQFIIATHSPFIVSSERDSAVYVLRYSKDQGGPAFAEALTGMEGSKVYSQKLDNINKAGTASEILMEVLGVPATIPEWVEEDIKALVKEFSNKPVDTSLLNALRGRLNGLGFGEHYPTALAALMDIK